MKNYLVDVPVMINVWARPEIQRQTFEPVKKARPSKLYLISDGPRNDKEKERILESRAIVEDIDWKCEVHKMYMDSNQGMYAMLKKQYDYVFSQEDRCIVLEDDVLVSVSFFKFCAELLEKYKDDLRVTAINGTNHRGKWHDEDADYFFTNGNAILGYAMWKRSYDLHYREDVFKDDILLRQLIRHVEANKYDYIARCVLNSYKAYKNDPTANGHPPAIEFYRSFINITQGQMDIVPSKNMVTNIGSEEGTHSLSYKVMPKRVQSYFYQDRYELDGEIRHPQFFIRDFEYEEWFQMSVLSRFGMNIEKGYKYLRYLGVTEIIKRFKGRLKRKGSVEK